MSTDDNKLGSPMWLLILLMLTLLAGAVFYFGKNNPNLSNTEAYDNSPSRAPRIYTVFYDAGVFSPTNIRIHLGDSVRFQNDGSDPIRVASEIINGVAEVPGFDSTGDIPPDGAFAFTFNQTGTFGYNNTYNKNERGTVTVRP